MVKKFIFSLVFVTVSLAILKVGVDLCLPYRSSAIFSILSNRETLFCETLSYWDELGRIERTRIFEVLIIPMNQMEKDALNPSVIGFGDVLLFWRVPLILPLIVEQVPYFVTSNLKLVVFALSSSLFLAFVIHYFFLVYKAIMDLFGYGSGPRGRSKDELRVASLMNRGNSANSIVSPRKGQL